MTRVDCKGNSSGSEADDDEELEDGNSIGASEGTGLKTDEEGAKDSDKVLEGGGKSGGRNAGSMFDSEEELDKSNDDLESDELV